MVTEHCLDHRCVNNKTAALVSQVKHKCNNYNTAYKDLNEEGRRRMAAGRINPKVLRCNECFLQLDG